MTAFTCSRSSSVFHGQGLKTPRQRWTNPLLSCSKRNVLRVSSESWLEVQGVSYRVPGTQHDILNQVTFSLPEKSLGLIYGRSGSGKTTLLQVLAGLAKPTEGSIFLKRRLVDGPSEESLEILTASKVGLVFQFPERYFLADTVGEELTFGWPRHMVHDQLLWQQFERRLKQACLAVGLNEIPLDLNPRSLSDGFKRRLSLAIQLVRMPEILLLDEPLAGLGFLKCADAKQRIYMIWLMCLYYDCRHFLRNSSLLTRNLRFSFLLPTVLSASACE